MSAITIQEPKAPCSQYCPDRGRLTREHGNCHSKECPHGWSEYEEARRQFYEDKQALNSSMQGSYTLNNQLRRNELERKKK